MNDKLKLWVLGGFALAVLLLSAPGKKAQESVFGHGDSFQSINFNLIGTSASPSTLTSTYGSTSSSNISITGLPNLAFTGSYTPKSYGSAIYVLIERSVDKGATYQPYSVIVPGSSSIPIYAAGASSTAGIPFLFPGAGTGSAASGTAIGFSFDLTMAADRFRVLVKESTTSTAGTLSLQGIASSN